MDRVKVLKAIADETRMKILLLLLKNGYCVRGLANKLNLSEATISQHLKVMREAGLLAGEKRGYFMHYNVERTVLHELAGEIEALAAIEREACITDERGNCSVVRRGDCHKKGQCGNDVREFCHGKDYNKEDEHHENCQCHKS